MIQNLKNMRSWTFTEKFRSEVKESGPWDLEPDKVQWIDETTDLDCLIVRNHAGALCGYVGVPPTHPWFGKSYGDCLLHGDDNTNCEYPCERIDEKIEVHGGLTFSGLCQDNNGGQDIEVVCHLPEPGRPEVFWFGFDTAHCNDLVPLYSLHWNLPATYRDVDYVVGEVTHLAHQLAAMIRA